MNRLLPWLLALLLSAAGVCLDGDPDYFQLLHADKLRNVTYGENVVRELIGNVLVGYGDLEISCDRARHDIAVGELECRGQVVVTHRGRVLRANEMTYYEKARRLEAYGNVRMTEDSLRAECVRGIYHRDSEQLEMRREAMLEDLEREVLFTADRIDYDHLSGIAWSRSQPLLRARHPQQGNIKVVAKYMEMRRFQHLEIAAGDVVIKLRNTEAGCDTFIYCDTSGFGQMKGTPLLVHDGREIRGEYINLLVAGEVLRAAEVYGSGSAVVPADSVDARLLNSLSGDSLLFQFEQGELRRMEARGAANSVYFARDEQGQPGLNLAAGDMIVLEMDSTALKLVEVRGGSQGRYLPLQEPVAEIRKGYNGEPESD
ncbi:MAG: hypothetical protein ISR91_04650 [Candidatus Delongbacteria bacterium]|nr:hypothetical protein [Candidatus Delongbacteria bacterium]